MSELAETTEFLAARQPWSLLAPARVASLARRAIGSYARRGTVLLSAGSSPGAMHVVRSGAVEVRDADGVLITHEEAGACFGQASIIEARPSRFTFTAIEDTLLWSFDTETVTELIADPRVRAFFTDTRIGDAVSQVPEAGPVLQSKVEDMLTRAAVTIGVDGSVGDAARAMDAAGISAIMVMDGDRLAGILTDRDLRRVVADGIPGSTRLDDVMSHAPFTISSDALALDVLLALVEHRIHHLPVLDGDRVVGMVTSGDLMRLERSSPLYLVGDLARQSDVDGLAEVMGRTPLLIGSLLRQDATAEDITRIVSRTTDALWQRLIELAEETLGPAPVPYCWVALGSLARQEQALGSDQDHAMILSDDATHDQDGYFSDLARYVADGLVECGFPLCEGEAMSTTPQWRQPLSAWGRQFQHWLASPTADAVLNSSIFFDMRPVYGDHALAAALQQRVRATARDSTRFLGHLAAHADDVDVPIGFLRGFVVERHGEHRDRLDIKRGGIMPIVDVARLYALRFGLPQVGTRARLAAAAQHGVEVDNLLDAHEFLGYTRLRHQGRQVAAGLPPDNFISPGDLSDFERRHLREAFAIVRRAQAALKVTFQTHVLT